MEDIKRIAAQPEVKAALAGYKKNLESILDMVIRIQQIPAPTFQEAARADYVYRQFIDLGLEDVTQDDLHNVYGRLPGRAADEPPLVVSAHTDTVFAADTDLAVRREDKRLYGPGIADNSLGVAGLLMTAATMREMAQPPYRDIWFVANVCEEGLGDLNGMRAVVERFGSVAGYIVVEGGLFGRICHQAIGVRRFRIDVETPGGHSWGAFGNPSAIHVLGHIISAIDSLAVPAEPKTTYNVGVIEGGTTINSIAGRAHLLLDLRSESPEALEKLVGQVEAIVAEYGKEADVDVHISTIGNRPAGNLSREHPLVQAATNALLQVGAGKRIEYTTGSTDANIPLSHGWPTVCIGLTESANAHRPDEYLEVADIPAGLGQLLLLVLSASNGNNTKR